MMRIGYSQTVIGPRFQYQLLLRSETLPLIPATLCWKLYQPTKEPRSVRQERVRRASKAWTAHMLQPTKAEPHSLIHTALGLRQHRVTKVSVRGHGELNACCVLCVFVFVFGLPSFFPSSFLPS